MTHDPQTAPTAVPWRDTHDIATLYQAWRLYQASHPELQWDEEDPGVTSASTALVESTLLQSSSDPALPSKVLVVGGGSSLREARAAAILAFFQTLPFFDLTRWAKPVVARDLSNASSGSPSPFINDRVRAWVSHVLLKKMSFNLQDRALAHLYAHSHHVLTRMALGYTYSMQDLAPNGVLDLWSRRLA